MFTNGSKTYDCDVFCIGDFDCYKDISITGNLYVKGDMSVSNVAVRGNIIVDADYFVMARSLKASGKIVIYSPCIDIKKIEARDCRWFASSKLC